MIAAVSGGRALQRVELFERIRRDRRLENASIRELGGRYTVHRRVVRQALDSALPPKRKEPVMRRSALYPAKGWIDEMLRSDLTAPPKQRHTNKRILNRLRDEYDFTAVAYVFTADAARRATPCRTASRPSSVGPRWQGPIALPGPLPLLAQPLLQLAQVERVAGGPGHQR